MSILFVIILATFLISLVAFVGALTLLLKEELLNKILLVLVAFSAGALLGGAFFHLIPEAIEEVGESQIFSVFLALIAGFCAFFILEHFIKWHHHHSMRHPEIKSFSYLILVSDGLHNFIDGVVIAASFLVSLPIGIMTSMMVVLHEIPQEIGDFGVLIYGGIKKTKALFLNFLSGITAIFGGVVGYFLAEKIGDSIVYLLPFAAGTFIYVACSDLIPEIKEKTSKTNFFVFLLGIGLMILMKSFI